jgi:predicted PurR-regulated permease PerM
MRRSGKKCAQETRLRDSTVIIMQESSLPPVVSRTCTLVFFVVIVGILYWFRELFIPLALAVLLTFLLAPVATRLERAGVGRVVAAVCAVMLGILVVGGVGYTFTGQLADLANKLPQYRATISKKLETIRHPEIGPFSRATATISGLLDEMEGKTAGAPPLPEAPRIPTPAQPANTFDFVRILLGQAISMLGTGAVVFVCVLFFLIDRNDIRDRLISLTGRQRFHTTTRALNDAGKRVSSYLLMQLVVNVTYGVPIALGLFLIGIPNAGLWGLLCTILRFVPYLGPILGAAFPILLSFAVFEGWTQPLLTLGLFLVMEIISNNLIEPWLYASSTGLSKTAIILAAIFWTWLWGGIGLLLATPLTVCLAVMGKYIPQLSFLDVLLGTRSAMAPSDQFYQRLLAFREDEAATVARKFLKEHSLSELCDSLLVPALIQIKAGVNEGVLEDRHLEFACDTIDEFMTEQIAELPPPEETKSGIGPVVFVPAAGITDETIVRIMSGLLEAEGFVCETLSSQSLAGEVITDMSDRACAQVCISASPPLAQRKARYLLKRLTGALPNVPVVTALWGASQDRVERLRSVTSSIVVTSVRSVLAEIRQNLALPAQERISGSPLSAPEPDKIAAGG